MLWALIIAGLAAGGWGLLRLRARNIWREKAAHLDALYARAHDHVLVLLTLMTESPHVSHEHLNRVASARLAAHSGMGARTHRSMQAHMKAERALHGHMRQWLTHLRTTPDAENQIIADVLQHYNRIISSISDAELNLLRNK